jgi:hypothetical protein
LTKKEKAAQIALGTYKWKKAKLMFEVEIYSFTTPTTTKYNKFTKEDIENIIKVINEDLLGRLDRYLITVKSSKVISSSWK